MEAFQFFEFTWLIIILTCLQYLQCYEGKPLIEFDRARMFRSGLVGFTLHGSLSHYYYQFCEVIMWLKFIVNSI